MNRLRMALIYFNLEIDKKLEDLLSLDEDYFEKQQRKVDFNSLSKGDQFFFICKLIVQWYKS